MAYDAKVLSAALSRYQAEQNKRRTEREKLTKEVFRRVPRVEKIDQELRTTAIQLIAIAFDGKDDPEAAMQALERRNLDLQRQRAELLVGAGYAYDCLDDAPECRQCGDSGFLSDGTPCQCLRQYYTREQNQRLSKLLDLGGQSFETFSLQWYDDQVWPNWKNSPRKNMEAVLEICTGYALLFSRNRGNLLFTGAPGLGKTFLSSCIAREVSAKGFSVVYDTAAHVFQQFESGKFGRENPFEEDPDQEINRYLNCDLLIMDDVGTEMLTSFVQSVFYRIVNDRLMNRRSTILSTNLDIEELGSRYGAAVRSRIQGEYQTLRFFGHDIRKLKRS